MPVADRRGSKRRLISTAVVSARRRILLIEGESDVCHARDQELRARGCTIERACTRDDAVRRVTAAQPDLVVIDLDLPSGDAIPVLRSLRDRAPTVTVMVISAVASFRAVVTALQLGARRSFVKPVSAEVLLATLETEAAHRPNISPSPSAPGEARDPVAPLLAIARGLVCVAGFDGYFKVLSPAWERTLGYSIRELCAQPYLDLIHPDDRDRPCDETCGLRAGRAVFRFKNRYRCRNGSYRWLAWMATACPAQELVYASARDITKSVRTDQGLRSTNARLAGIAERTALLLDDATARNRSLTMQGRLRDDRATALAHDLRNPLSVIVANSEYILDEYEGSANGREALLDSQQAGQRMLQLLEKAADPTTVDESGPVRRPLDNQPSPVRGST